MAEINRVGGISDRGPKMKNATRRLLQNTTGNHGAIHSLRAVAPTMKIIARQNRAAMTNKPPSAIPTFFSVSPNSCSTSPIYAPLYIRDKVFAGPVKIPFARRGPVESARLSKQTRGGVNQALENSRHCRAEQWRVQPGSDWQ